MFRDKCNIFVVVVLMVVIQIGPIESINVTISGRSIRLYQLLAPFLLSVIVLSNLKYKLDTKSLLFLAANFIIILLLALHPRIGFLDVLNHGLSIYMGVAIAHLIISGKIKIDHVAQGLFVGAILLSVYNIYNLEYITSNDPGILGVPKFVGPELGSGANGTVLSTGVLSGVLLSLKNNDGLLTVVVYAISFLLSILVILSQSRSSIIALVIGLGLVLVYVSEKKTRYNIVRELFVFVTTAGVLGGVYLATLNPNSVYSRLAQVEAGIEVLSQYPLAGVGWNNFYPTYYSEHIIHFTPLNYFVFGGVLVGILYLFTLLYPLFLSLRAMIVNRQQTALGYILLGMYMIVFIELLLYRKTPSNHHIILGFLLIVVSVPTLRDHVQR